MKKFMKKFLILIFIVLVARPCFSAFVESMDTRRTYKHAYRWTGKPKDKLLTWAKEVEDRLTGIVAVEYIYYSPTDTEPAAAAKGTLYYDLSEEKLKFRNASSWVAIEAGSTGNSLDGAYDVGRSITVDAGTVTLTGTNAGDNVVLTLVQSDTGTTKGVVITNAGTGNTIDIQGQASSNDIEGTDDSWGISSIGTFTGVIGTWTGDQTWTGSTANVLFDATDDELLIEDSAILSFGDAADVTVTWNATNLLIEAATDNTGQIQLGATNAMDLKIVGSTNTDIALFDANPGILLMDSYPIALGDGDAILFGDTLGTGDFTISDASDVLTIDNIVDGTGTVSFGTSGAGIDVLFYGDAGSGLMTWDENQNTNGALVFNNADIELGDADLINFGDSDDFSMTATNQAFTFGSLTSDESSTYSFGADTDGDDVKMFGATTGEYWLWDAGADSILPVCGNALYTLTDAEADQFKVNATGATSDAVAINFETTDGKILLNADGGTGGDIELNSADDTIITSAGKVTITNTEAVTISGAFVPDTVVVPDGAAYTVLANNAGQVHIVIGQASDLTMDLPAEADDLYYKFVYAAGAADAQDWSIDSENNTNFFIGGLVQHDTDNAGDDTATYYSDGNSNSKVSILTPGAGTVVEVWCDGTNWYISGTVVSATDTGAVFADQ